MFATLRQKLFGNGVPAKEKASKSLAKSRLHFVLVQDRTGLSPEEMTGFKREMVAVIEKYFEIDEQGFDITYKRESDTSTLLINSPVIVRKKSQPRADNSGTKGGKKDKEEAAAEAVPAEAQVAP